MLCQKVKFAINNSGSTSDQDELRYNIVFGLGEKSNCLASGNSTSEVCSDSECIPIPNNAVHYTICRINLPGERQLIRLEDSWHIANGPASPPIQSATIDNELSSQDIRLASSSGNLQSPSMKFPLRAVKALKSGVENSGLVSGRSCTEIHPQTQQRNSSTDEESKVVQSYFKTQGWNLIRPISAAYSPPCDSPQPNTASSLSSSALDLLYQPLSTNLNLASRDSLALNIIVAISPLLFIPIERRSAKNGISDTLGRFSLNRAILREILPAESQTGEDSDSETEENENGDEEEEEEEQEESEEIEDELDTRDEIVEQNEGGNE